MKILVIGASGMVGRAITQEAIARSHAVRGASRRPTQATDLSLDATDGAQVLAALHAVTPDVVVSATRPAPGEEELLMDATSAVAEACLAAQTRLLVVNGAGSLQLGADPDHLVVQDRSLVPEALVPLAAAGVGQLDLLQVSDPALSWSAVSPPVLLQPGPRTGRYRRGGDVLLRDAAGSSHVSVADLAVAVVDELEQPRAHRRRFTVAALTA